MNAAHIGVQNEWKAAVLVWRSCCSQTFIICCKHDMQIRFDDNFSANHRPPETDWKQTIEMLFPFLEMCNRGGFILTIAHSSTQSSRQSPIVLI